MVRPNPTTYVPPPSPSILHTTAMFDAPLLLPLPPLTVPEETSMSVPVEKPTRKHKASVEPVPKPEHPRQRCAPLPPDAVVSLAAKAAITNSEKDAAPSSTGATEATTVKKATAPAKKTAALAKKASTVKAGGASALKKGGVSASTAKQPSCQPSMEEVDDNEVQVVGARLPQGS